MVNSWLFRILLLLGGIVGVLGFLEKQADYWDFRLHGQPALLEQNSKASPPSGQVFVIDDVALQSLQVRFKTVSGEQVVYERGVPVPIVAQLVKGEQVEIVYLPDNSRRFIYKGEELPLGIPWLVLGIAMTGVFAISLRLK